MARKWSAKDRRQVTWELVFLGVATLFVLAATTPMQRSVASVFALLFAVGIAAQVLPLLRQTRKRETSKKIAALPFQRLSRARVKEIVGLVDFPGVYDLDRAVIREPQPCFSMRVWRVRNGRLRKGLVFVHRRAGNLKCAGAPPLIPSYSVLRFRARMRTNFLGAGEALLEETLGIETSDAGLNRVRESLDALSMEDPVLGVFTRSQSGDAWFGLTTWMGRGVSVTLKLGNHAAPDNFQQSLRVAHALWQNQKDWDRSIRDFASRPCCRRETGTSGQMKSL